MESPAEQVPDVTVNGVRLHYVDLGAGSEAVVFSHRYLLDWSHFEPQIDALSDRYRCIAFDHRGHGGSQRPAHGYGMEDIYADALAFIEAMGCAPVHFVGLSTGGFIGLRLGYRRPDLLRTLTLMDTSAEAEPWWARLRYELVMRAGRVTGTRPLVGYVMSFFFSKAFRRDPRRKRDLARFRRRLLDNDHRVMTEFGRAIFRREGVVEHLAEVRVPTLVVVGAEDRAQPPARARRIVEETPGSRLLVVPGAAHISSFDGAEAVTAALEEHLARG